jgi:SpoVK/Ycf46/Vps4 family AAA+-type ATPase
VTAEALSESLGKPLYMVGAGELGTSATEVEKKLRQVLDVATFWNAVLLIDECDIFLEKRTKNDIHRNAVVAIFLRMLEYYSGILFLTTNRVKELDKAFLSRISVALYYHKLGFKKRKKIWKGLAEKHQFEGVDFNKLAEHVLNGREIKSALKLALALAKSEKRNPTMADIEHVIDFGDQFRAVGIGARKKRR